MKSKSNWTLERLTLVAIVIILLALIGTGLAAFWGGRLMTQATHEMSTTYANARELHTLFMVIQETEDTATNYVLRGDESFLKQFEDDLVEVRRKRQAMGDFSSKWKGDTRAVTTIAQLDKMVIDLSEIVTIRRQEGADAAFRRHHALDPDAVLDQLEPQINGMIQDAQTQAGTSGEYAATTFRNWIFGGLCIIAIFTVVLPSFIIRYMAQNVGAVLSQIQSSTVELHAAAAEQVSGAKEQVTAASEVSTTIKELLSTSRQIAESAQKVTKIAVETSGAAKVGDQTVHKAQDAIDTVRHQVDLIVNHMLDLGRKSQEIGGILDIINELSEQTNILAINATIESAGAGESGRRFAVVADEIRKLADRVSGSTKEIRSLIEEIRAAANTTVMATEDGSKAVDAGTRQFTEVAVAFKQIVDLVSSTAMASREIELSTKQQTTAVEQVNAAISEVARTARETEASLNQTLQTVSELTTQTSLIAGVIRANAKQV